MTVIVDKKLSKKETKALLDSLKKKPKLFDAKKYFGKFTFTGDPLEIQKEMRDE